MKISFNNSNEIIKNLNKSNVTTRIQKWENQTKSQLDSSLEFLDHYLLNSTKEIKNFKLVLVANRC